MKTGVSLSDICGASLEVAGASLPSCKLCELSAKVRWQKRKLALPSPHFPVPATKKYFPEIVAVDFEQIFNGMNSTRIQLGFVPLVALSSYGGIAERIPGSTDTKTG